MSSAPGTMIVQSIVFRYWWFNAKGILPVLDYIEMMFSQHKELEIDKK
jgi:hypothetical protein